MDTNSTLIALILGSFLLFLFLYAVIKLASRRGQAAELQKKADAVASHNRELLSQLSALQSRNTLLEDGNSLKKVFGTELSYVVAIHDILDPILPPMQSLEHLIATITPEMQKSLNIPLMQEMQLAVAGLTKQELEAMQKLRELLLRLTIVTRDETMQMIVNTRLTSAHLLAMKELFTRAGNLMPHMVEHPAMFDEAIRQLTLDIQRQREITNPKGLSLDKALYEQVRQSYTPVLEAATRRQKSLADTQPNFRSPAVWDELLNIDASQHERISASNPNKRKEK